MEKKEKEEKDFWKGFATGILTFFFLLVGVILGFCLAFRGSILGEWKNIYKIKVLEDLVDRYYLEETQKEDLAEGMYEGLIYGLGDVYSRYYTAEEYESKSQDNDGAYQGIGILMGKLEDGRIEIIECYEGSPAEQAGLQTGDIICKINDTDVQDKTLTEISNMVKTEEAVTLVVEREGKDMELLIQLGQVEMHTVDSRMLDDQIGYLAITEFKGVTYDQYCEAMKELQAQGMKKLIIDLRNNPGGLLTSVCAILREILPEGLIVYTEDKYGHREEEACDGENPLTIPLVVLINGESASAAEIFAGAVKDYGIGTLVGTTTFGKGIVQSIRKLSDGSAVKLTESKYYTPKGNDIHKVGIEADVVVEDSEEEADPPLEKAIEILKEK